MSRRIKAILGAGLTLIILACIVDAVRFQAPRDRPNFVATDLQGHTWSFADYRGHGPIILSFFSLT
jgi:hypothetical protein